MKTRRYLIGIGPSVALFDFAGLLRISFAHGTLPLIIMRWSPQTTKDVSMRSSTLGLPGKFSEIWSHLECTPLTSAVGSAPTPTPRSERDRIDAVSPKHSVLHWSKRSSPVAGCRPQGRVGESIRHDRPIDIRGVPVRLTSCRRRRSGRVPQNYCEHGYTQVKKIRTDLDFLATILDALGSSLDEGHLTE